MSGRTISLCVTIVLAIASGCNRPSPQSSSRNAREETDRYADSIDGLKQQISDIRAAIKAKDQRKIDELLEGLKLPDYERWFRRTFGEAPSAALAAEYKKALESWKELPDWLGYNLDQGDKIITISRVNRADDEAATGQQQTALKAMKTIVPAPLHKVSLGGRSVSSFVHVDGQFRLVGEMRALRQ